MNPLTILWRLIFGAPESTLGCVSNEDIDAYNEDEDERTHA